MQNISKDLNKESVHITNKDLDYDDILYGGWTKFSMEENVLPVNIVIWLNRLTTNISKDMLFAGQEVCLAKKPFAHDVMYSRLQA